MKKILLLDQPVKNRGDEAAHKSLLRRLTASFDSDCQITCLFRNIDEDTIKQMRVETFNVNYLVLKNWPKYKKIREWLIKSNTMFLGSMFPFNVEFNNLLKTIDVVVISSGGMNLGGFRTWNHLFLLLSCMKQKKQIIYYSRSIGPFYMGGKYDKKFSQKSIYVLKNVDFLSLRDKRSYQIADENKIQYHPSIDTAFLDVPHIKLPQKLESDLPERFVVFVPNELVWHPIFKNISRKKLIKVYLSMIDIICGKENIDILMLPQLFNSDNSDFHFFKEIKTLSKNGSRITVVPDTYSSDIQQAIISRSEFVVGGRYHSIVFAINNHVPFISLSYEHKMEGLLEILGLSHRSIPFGTLSDIENFNSDVFFNMLKHFGREEIVKAQNEANTLAIQTFNEAFRTIK